MYSSCTDNNRAETVFEFFQEAITENGIPSRVQCDHGGENVDVARFILILREDYIEEVL